jgi:dipeptidyl aminopeptidase/acylaminoacyl peptidase
MRPSMLFAVMAMGLQSSGTPLWAASAQAQPSRELIPRKLLFGNPTRTAATISPDGQHIAFLAPRDGVLNVWIAPTRRIADAQPLSAEKERPISQFFWSPDSTRVLYLQDKGGTEDFLLYGVSLANKSTINYTRFAKTRVELVRVSALVKDEILIGINNRDPKWHDVYRLNPTTGRLKLVWRNPGGYAGVVADRQLNLVIAQKALPDGGTQLERFGPQGTLTPIFKWGLEDALTTNVIGARDAEHVYMLDSRARNTAALSTLAPVTGAVILLGQDARADVNDGVVDPRSGDFELYGVEYLQQRWIGLTSAAKADVAFLDKEARGQWTVSSQSDDDRLWTVSVDRVSEPAAYYLYDRGARSLTKLFTVRPELEGKALATMHPLEIKARDGLILVSYLSVPPDSHANGIGVPDRPLPMVLFVHGGP